MGKNWKNHLSLMLCISMFLTAASCGRGGSGDNNEPDPVITKEPITLEYWRLFQESDILDQFISDYQDDHPNINIVVKKVDFKPGETIYDYQQEITKLIADGAGPDMFMIHNSWLPFQVNQIEPMPKGFMTANEFDDIFPDFAVDDFVQNDQVYAVPYNIDNLMLYYNTDILGAARLQPPKTLQDLVDIIPKLTKKDGSGNIIQSAIALGADTASIPRAADILAALMMQYGAEMTSPDKQTSTFNLPAPNSNPPYFSAREALAYYTQFANPGSTNTYTYTDAVNSQGSRILPVDIQAFLEGKAAMFIGNAYHIQNIQRFAPNKFHFDTAPLPQLRLQEPVTLTNYWGETVSRNSKHKTEAWDFIRYMSSKQNLSYFTRQTGTVPARKDLLESSSGKRYYGPVAQQASYARSWYRLNTPEVEQLFSKMINDVVKDGVSLEVAVDTAVRDINALNPNR